GLIAAACEALRHDGLEVVDVVQVAPRELVDRGIEVARNRQVDQEERTAAAGRKRGAHGLPGEDDAARARRGGDHVPLGELVPRPFERDGPSAEACRKLLRPLEAAVCDGRDGRATRDEVARGLLADLPCADDEDLVAGQVTENLLRKGRRGGGDGRGTL